MSNEEVKAGAAEWPTTQVYALAVVCLVIGLAFGYFFRGSRSAVPAGPVAGTVPHAAAPGAGAPAGMGSQPPTLDQMKQMADKKAEPLLTKLKADPKNADLLIQVGRIYFSTHQFKEAAEYLGKSLDVDPKNTEIRTEMASCLYYGGDVDGAIQQLTQVTTENPKDANSLFNLGMIRWKGKNDAQGALAAWAQLLKSNPKLEPAKREQVEKVMAAVRAQGKSAKPAEAAN